MMNNIHDVLHTIQGALKVPKSEWNDFGKYRYRNAEAILQSVKPLLPQGYHIITDCKPKEMQSCILVECTATLASAEGQISATAYAVEPESKKGMDAAQISGSTISYAKKYALGNLFAIDGTEDSDAKAPDDTKSAPTLRKWIARANELESRCIELGMKPTAVDEYLQAYFGTTDKTQLTKEQLTQYGKHLATLQGQLSKSGERS